MATSLRIAVFSGGYEAWISTVDPNGVIFPIRVGSTCYNQTNGHLYQCTALPSTWTDYDPAAGGSGWIDDGTIVRLTTSTDEVAIGRATMFGGEKLIVQQTDAVGNGITSAIALAHAVSVAAANGIGVAADFLLQNNAPAIIRAARIVATLLDVTAGSEDSALDFYNVSAGTEAARWSMGAVVGRPGDWFPKLDNTYDLGSTTARIRAVNAEAFTVWGTSGAANPVARLSSAGLELGQGSGVPLAWRLAPSPTSSVRAYLNTAMVLSATGALSSFETRTLDADLHPTMQMIGVNLNYGPGGATPVDVSIRRTGTKTLQVDDLSSGPVNLVSKGTLTTQARTLGAVFTNAGPYVVLVTDDFVGLDATAAPLAANLPDVTTIPEGHRVTIMNTGAVAVVNAVTANPFGAQTINLVAAPLVIGGGTTKATLISRNSGGVTGWYVMYG